MVDRGHVVPALGGLVGAALGTDRHHGHRVADTLPDGWRLWLDWLRLVAPDNATEIQALEADSGSHLGYVRVVGRRRAETQLSEPIVSVPTQYERKPLLRG